MQLTIQAVTDEVRKMYPRTYLQILSEFQIVVRPTSKLFFRDKVEQHIVVVHEHKEIILEIDMIRHC